MNESISVRFKTYICIDDAEDDEGDVRRGSASSFVFQEWFFFVDEWIGPHRNQREAHGLISRGEKLNK